jgi:RNA polymerase sigma-70 factor, ECF subfamily
MSGPVSSPDERSPRPAARSTQCVLDARAFEALFKECAADVHGYLISLLGDSVAAEDATALAFERLYRSRARLDHRRGTPRAWLFAIARNAALDELRQRRRKSRYGPVEELADDRRVSEDALLEDVERRATVQDALASLSLRDREIVLLKFHGQLSNSELARAMGISETNAGTRLHRALTRLRAHCAETGREQVA